MVLWSRVTGCVAAGAASLLLLPFLANPASAQTPWWQPIELRAGITAHDVKPISSGTEPGAAFIGELLWQPLLMTSDHKLALRPGLGVSASLSGDTSFFFLDGVLEYRPFDAIYLDFGLGLALHDGYTTPAPRGRRSFGSRELFHVSADVGTRITDNFGVSIYFDHVSNAGLFSSTNQGLETIGIRWAWMF